MRNNAEFWSSTDSTLVYVDGISEPASCQRLRHDAPTRVPRAHKEQKGFVDANAIGYEIQLVLINLIPSYPR